MPFVLAPEFAAVAAAALLAMLCIAAYKFIQAIGAVLPTFNLGVVKIPIGKWFTSITSPVVSWLVGATNTLWADAGWWMHGIAYIASGFANDVASLFSHVFGQVDHVVTVTIPQALGHAAGSATHFVEQEIGTLHRDIATATTAIEKVASGDAARALAKAEGFAGTVKASLTKLVAHDLTIGERYADQKLAEAKAYVDGAIKALPAIPGKLIAGIDYATPAAVGVVAGAVAAVASEFESCAVTSCDGPNNLSNLLKGILGFASLAEVGVFLEKVINDPAAAEAQYAGVFSGIVSPIVTGGGDVWSDIESVLGL